VIAHGVLIAAFSFCAVSLSGMLRGSRDWPARASILVAFCTCFSFFLQLRIADEFKDFEEDRLHRPYRPVPRGLVSLRELGWLFAILGAIQLVLALWLDFHLIVLLAVTWVYLALMSKEFFVGTWLRRRHVLYMLSHMAIMPLIDLYATSTQWLPLQNHPPRGLIWFLLASYCNGLVIETGRKIRSPADEEPGVETYSVLWGRTAAVISWWTVMLATAGFGIIIGVQLGRPILIGGVLLGCWAGAIVIGSMFLARQTPRAGKWIENYAGLWTLVLYLGLGLLPRLMNWGQP
jgi:4-hydroxybenzoate polyprenyltransferase